MVKGEQEGFLAIKISVELSAEVTSMLRSESQVRWWEAIEDMYISQRHDESSQYWNEFRKFVVFYQIFAIYINFCEFFLLYR